MNIEDLGFEIKKNPINQVRLSFHENKWYVEYRKNSKVPFLNKWWYDDSKYSSYIDANARAEFLAAAGYYETLEKKLHIYNVNQN